MKPKLIIIATAVVLSAGTTLFIRCRVKQKAEATEVNAFLYRFNDRVKAGNTDSVMTFFQTNKNTKLLKRLVNLLTGKKAKNGEKPLASIMLNIDNTEITNVNGEIITANIPVNLTHESIETRYSILSLRIYQSAPHKFKIIQADARRFYTDYVDYADYVRKMTLTDKDLYRPETLAAFKTAGQLKTRYDSVIWFAHLDAKTYYYVIKGKWNIEKDIPLNKRYSRFYKDSIPDDYKMGLVNPDLKEIIPVEYDLIHNISATFTNLIEVEKGAKKGFYNLAGKIVIPVSYDQIFPITDEANLAVLRNGNDFYYLKKDTTISEKVDLKISDFFAKIKNLTNSFNLYKNALVVITEYNSRENQAAIYIPPSYLVDLNMIAKWGDFQNPLRKEQYEDIHKDYNVGFSGLTKEDGNWLETSFYSIRDYFLGGRSEFYDTKNLVILDKKNNRVFGQEIQTDYSPEEGDGFLDETCDINSVKAINDSLLEVKSGAGFYAELYDSTKAITGGPYYHYLMIKNNRLIELPDHRNFGFTKYVKMDDAYLLACYSMLTGFGRGQAGTQTTIDHLSPEVLHYMKNEIYADYRYQFKDKRWQQAFASMDSYIYNSKEPNNVNVDDSLTAIDKYNINWISQKLKTLKTNANTLAAK